MARTTPDCSRAELAAASAESPGQGGLVDLYSGDLFSRLRTRFFTRRAILASLQLGAAVLVLASLVGFSLYLAAMRIFQVDECCNVFVAHIASQGTNVHTLFQYLLSLSLSGATRSIDLLVQARCMMVLVFWVNILLLALATGEKLASSRGIVALVGAATLAPLWDYGFEVRHDNLLLTGMLLTWCVARVHPRGLASYVVAGGLSATMLLIASKAPAYVLPLTVGILAFPPKFISHPRWKLATCWLAGGVGAYLLLKLTCGRVALMGDYGHSVGVAVDLSSGGTRFAPWWTLSRLFAQTPLLLAISTAATLALVGRIWTRRAGTLAWTGVAPEAGLLGVATLALLVNPTPYPYNLVNFVPFLFLFSYRYLAGLVPALWSRAEVRTALIAVMIFTHLGPFLVATARHLDHSNARQDRLMTLSEVLTDPVQDPVYDGVRMVSTRPIVDPRSFSHGTSLERFYDGTGPTLRGMLTSNPPAVIIKSYRTHWMPDEDQEFIASRYVALADDFHILGAILPAGGGAVEIVHPGRYRVASFGESDLSGSYKEGFESLLRGEDGPEFECALNGEPLGKTVVVELVKGSHQITCSEHIQPTVVWVGPTLDRLPRLEGGSHLELFVNWY